MDEMEKDLEIKETAADNNAEAMDSEDALVREIYEVGFQVIPDIAEEEVTSLVSKIRGLLEKRDSEIISEGAPELRDLAYEMTKKIGGRFKKFNRGYFGWIKFETPRDGIVALKKEIESLDEVLRFIIIKTVRENTLISQKIQGKKQDEDGEETTDAVAPAENLDTEIEKTLEDLEIK